MMVMNNDDPVAAVVVVVVGHIESRGILYNILFRAVNNKNF